MMDIAVDLDGVLADFEGHLNLRLDMAGERAATIPRVRTEWDLMAGLTHDEKRVMRDILERPGFFAGLDPLPGAKRALENLVDRGHEVFIVTSPYVSNPTCASDKMAWVERHLGRGWATKRLVITTDKTRVRADVLIDDKPVITGSRTPEWERIFFGDYEYNRQARLGRIQMLSWEDDAQVDGALIAAAVVRTAR